MADTATVATNPFFESWTAPFGAPPFDRIRPEHYLPAFRQGMAEERRAIDAIAADPAPATFDNTILAMQLSDTLLQRVSSVFFCLSGII